MDWLFSQTLVDPELAAAAARQQQARGVEVWELLVREGTAAEGNPKGSQQTSRGALVVETCEGRGCSLLWRDMPVQDRREAKEAAAPGQLLFLGTPRLLCTLVHWCWPPLPLPSPVQAKPLEPGQDALEAMDGCGSRLFGRDGSAEGEVRCARCVRCAASAASRDSPARRQLAPAVGPWAGEGAASAPIPGAGALLLLSFFHSRTHPHPPKVKVPCPPVPRPAPARAQAAYYTLYVVVRLAGVPAGELCRPRHGLRDSWAPPAELRERALDRALPGRPTPWWAAARRAFAVLCCCCFVAQCALALSILASMRGVIWVVGMSWA